MAELRHQVSLRLSNAHRPARNIAGVIWALVLVSIVVPTAFMRYPLLDQHTNDWAREYAVDLLGMIPEDSVLVDPPCCDFYDRAMSLMYEQQMVGKRQDVSFYRYYLGATEHLYRPSYITSGPETIPLLDPVGEHSYFFPQVGAPTKQSLDLHFALKPVDTSIVSVDDLLEEIPAGSIVLLANRQPVPWIVDVDLAQDTDKTARAVWACGRDVA